jgi:hypothetical protein
MDEGQNRGDVFFDPQSVFQKTIVIQLGYLVDAYRVFFHQGSETVLEGKNQNGFHRPHKVK